MIGAGVRDSCGKSESRGDPAGAKAPRADRPRKASAWGVEINVQIAQTPKKLKRNSIFIEFVFSLRKGSFQRSFSLVKEPLGKKKLQ
ncbi:hypothetical protein [Peribacillus frigoritolerans]|uniref:hypothetical protein n=1 Tax=Peribacillus frigoritolerans TaxID=450367 RepID=UPI0007BF8566